MTKMYDGEWDPLITLQGLCRQQEEQARQFLEMAKAFNSRQKIIDEIVRHVNHHAQMLENLEERIMRLENAQK
jgi:hypothetical protein